MLENYAREKMRSEPWAFPQNSVVQIGKRLILSREFRRTLNASIFIIHILDFLKMIFQPSFSFFYEHTPTSLSRNPGVRK